jgi:hypothetical protein
MQQVDAEAVARMERFLVLTIFENPDTAVGEYAVTIH